MARKMAHSVSCTSCDFLFQEVSVMPSDDWYAASDHDRDCANNGEVVLEHFAQ
jgi:hypothetical protein